MQTNKDGQKGLEAWIVLGLAFVVISFAVNSVITRFLVLDDLVPPFALTTIRFVSGLIILISIHKAMPRNFDLVGMNKRNFIGGLFLGVYGFSISFGYQFIGAAAGTLVFYTCVMITMSLYCYECEREVITKLGLGSQILAFVGLLVITFGNIKSVTVAGVALMALTGVSWGLYSVYGRRFQNSFSYTLHSFLIVSLFSLSISGLSLPFLPESSYLGIIPAEVGLGALVIALCMGTLSTALSYVVWHRILKRIRSSTGGIVQMLIPVVGAAMAIILLGEEVEPALILGGVLIVSGIYLNTKYID